MLHPQDLSRLVHVALVGILGHTVHAQGNVDWPVYLGEDSSQYSELSQITPQNVEQLEVAWMYRSGDADEETNRSQIQTSPIVVDGVLYGVSPATKIFALDAATGERRW